MSIYLRTTPVTQETRGDRIELKNSAKQAVHRLHVAGADKLAWPPLPSSWTIW